MAQSCITIRELRMILNNIPEGYLDTKVKKMNNEYGCGLEDVLSVEFILKINDRGTNAYLEID